LGEGKGVAGRDGEGEGGVISFGYCGDEQVRF